VDEHDEVKEPGESIDQVKGRLDEIKRRHRGRIRWRITKHTAEIAIRVIESDAQPSQTRKSGKSRRRKRKKRLL
jgi:hypothetical protein